MLGRTGKPAVLCANAPIELLYIGIRSVRARRCQRGTLVVSDRGQSAFAPDDRRQAGEFVLHPQRISLFD